MAAITSAVVVAGAAVGSAAMQANAAKKAAKAQSDALANQKGVDIDAVSQQARDADLQKYRDQFNLLAEVDPQTGEIREKTNAALNQYASGDENESNANAILSTLFNENVNPDATDVNFYNNLRSEAQKQLSLGGQLSPEQQAEFVRAGLEGASTTGLNAGSSAARQSIGKLLASEQQNLLERRQNMARDLFGFATELKSNRNATLGSIAGQNLTASNLRGNKLLNLAQLADSRTPDVGLSGGDIANLAVGNTNQQNQVELQKGAIAANQAQARGQIAAGLIGGLSGAVGSYAQYKATPSYSQSNRDAYQKLYGGTPWKN